MVKVIMKRVPKKIDPSTQYEVMRNWSAAMVDTPQQKQTLKIISSKEAKKILGKT